MIRRAGLKSKPGGLKKRVGLRKKRTGTMKHKAWAVFSQYIRQREMDENGMVSCISCGKVDHWKNMDAGHYVPKSVSLVLRFSEIAVQNQCTACNRFRHGNLTQYALALQRKYGPEVLEKLDTIRRENQNYRLSEQAYVEIYERYKALVKDV